MHIAFYTVNSWYSQKHLNCVFKYGTVKWPNVLNRISHDRIRQDSLQQGKKNALNISQGKEGNAVDVV